MRFGMGGAPSRAPRPGARVTSIALMVFGAMLPASAAHAQTLADRVRSAPDGLVRLTFAARPDVCGDGRSMISFTGTDRGGPTIVTYDRWRRDRCIPGPVRVELTVRDHRVTDIDTHVGGGTSATPRAGRDATHDDAVGRLTVLGAVPATEAARYFVALARRLDDEAGRDAILPAVLADSVDVTPDLIRLVRDASVPVGTRKRALFWAGQAGAPIAELDAMYDDLSNRELRKEAIFVLSQREEPAATDKLFDIVKTDHDVRMRKQAMFWLAQRDDPRVARLFADILSR